MIDPRILLVVGVAAVVIAVAVLLAAGVRLSCLIGRHTWSAWRTYVPDPPQLYRYCIGCHKSQWMVRS